MSDRKITSVRTVSTETPGRVINSARHNHFIIDSPSGPGEAVSTIESFLAGISACGVTLVQREAANSSLTMDRLQVDIAGVRESDRPHDFSEITVEFHYSGVSQADAERLTDLWKER